MNQALFRDLVPDGGTQGHRGYKPIKIRGGLDCLAVSLYDPIGRHKASEGSFPFGGRRDPDPRPGTVFKTCERVAYPRARTNNRHHPDGKRQEGQGTEGVLPDAVRGDLGTIPAEGAKDLFPTLRLNSLGSVKTPANKLSTSLTLIADHLPGV